jgi:CelD/BcsL family acetyltransferase involved in cellulose biosynthesis
MPAAADAASLATGVTLAADDARWQRLVAGHPRALPFHGAGWISTLASCYGFDPFILALVDGEGQVQAGLPVMAVRHPVRGERWVALPFTDLCPPLLGRIELEAPLAAHVLAAAAADAGGRPVVVHAALHGLAQQVVAVVHRLDLSAGPEDVHREFTKPFRRAASQAKRNGVVLRYATSEADMTDAYYRLHLATRRRLGVPIQPRRFFALLWRRVVEPGGGTVLLACADGHPVAGAVFLHAAGTMIYKYGASDSRWWQLRPNNLIMHEAICQAAERGFDTFDFGRTDFANEGLRRFKTSCGGVESPLIYSGAGADLASGRGTATAALAAVIRRSPAWVCRGIGEVLYRYAA